MDVSQGFPVPNAPLLDSRGQLTDAWRRFFLTLWNRTGEGPGISSADLELLISLILARVDTTQLALSASQAASLRALTPAVQRNSQALDVALMALMKANTAGGSVRLLSQGTGITLTPNPINGAGTIALTVPVAVGNGGTGQTTYTNGQLLIGNTTGNTLAKSTLTAGTGITVTNGSGTITIAATGSTIPTSGLFVPQGRLSLVTGVPVMTSDQTAKAHVYYTPYVGATIPIYDGAAWGLQTMSADLDMALDTSNQLLNNVYDLYAWVNGSTLSIGAAQAWTNTATVTWTSASPGVCSWTAHGLAEGDPVVFTAGTSTPTGITAGTTYFVSKTGLTANAFSVSTSIANAAAGTNVNTSSTGTGTQTGTNHTKLPSGRLSASSGTAQLQLLNGIWTNAGSVTLTNGAGAGTSVSANRATYLGSIFCTANGQTGMAYQPAAAGGGTNNILGVFNAYNSVYVTAMSRDSTSSWSYNNTAWRAADGNVLNRISFLDGLQQATIDGTYTICANAASGGFAPTTGMNLDNTTAAPAATAQSNSLTVTQLTQPDRWAPQLGVHYVQAMEAAVGSITGCTFFGAQTTPTRQLNALTVSLAM